MCEGLSTHLASSEILDAPSVEEQIANFESARRIVREAGLNPKFIHVANTGAVIAHPETWNTMVRPGIALYGYHLSFERAGREVSGKKLRLPVKPVLTWKTRILALRDVHANQPLGYGGIYVTKAPARIAVLPVGYADGLNRHLSSHGRVIVRKFCPDRGTYFDGLNSGGCHRIAGNRSRRRGGSAGALEGLSVDAREHAHCRYGGLRNSLRNLQAGATQAR